MKLDKLNTVAAPVAASKAPTSPAAIAMFRTMLIASLALGVTGCDETTQPDDDDSVAVPDDDDTTTADDDDDSAEGDDDDSAEGDDDDSAEGDDDDSAEGDDDDSAEGDDDDSAEGDDDDSAEGDDDDSAEGDDDDSAEGDDDDSASVPVYTDGPLAQATQDSLDGLGSPSWAYGASEAGLDGSSTQVVMHLSLDEDTSGLGLTVSPLAYHAATETLGTTAPVATFEQDVPLVAASASNPNELFGFPAVATVNGATGEISIDDPMSTGSVTVCDVTGPNAPATNAADATWVMYDALGYFNGDPNPQVFGHSFDDCETTDAASLPIEVSGDGTRVFMAMEQ